MNPDTAVALGDQEREWLAGEQGPALQLATKVIVAVAEAVGAQRLVEVSSAHIDGCLYHGRAGLDFAERLVAGAGRVRVPSTLNVSSLDLLHPELVRLAPDTRREARRLMDAYVELGCQPTWTCAPYQLPSRPALGEHVAWAESNAIVFANSVLGARTGRYGDFMDISAAITGLVPHAGLHLDSERRARVVVRVEGLAGDAFSHDELYALLGHVLGQELGALVPAVVGLPPETTEDQLKALGAAAASSGSVALMHVVGVTPEAPSLADALGGRPADHELSVGPERMRQAWAELSSAAPGTPLAAVSIGTPHLSLAEFKRLTPLVAALDVHESVTLYVSTARDVLAQLGERGWAATYERPGVQLVVDTCTYITPILQVPAGTVVMTNSAKWAWYAPANLGVRVAFGTLEDCLASAAAGRVVRSTLDWLDG